MSATFSFTVSHAGVDRLLHDPAGPLGRWFLQKGNASVNGAKARANVDTGLMRSRIEFRLVVEGGRLVGYLAARTDYSLYVHAYNPFLLDGVREAFAT